jgi:hypothetical protein
LPSLKADEHDPAVFLEIQGHAVVDHDLDRGRKVPPPRRAAATIGVLNTSRVQRRTPCRRSASRYRVETDDEITDERALAGCRRPGTDVRLSIRSLARTRGFTLVALLYLALGIGANAALFSVVHAAFIRPSPVAELTALSNW